MSKLYIQQRGDKWQYSFDVAKVNGKRKRITKCGFPTKSAANKAGTKALSDYLHTGVYYEPSNLSFSDFIDSWMIEYCKINLKEVTQQNYEKRIRLYLKPALGMYKISMLSPSVLQNFLNQKALERFSRNSLVSLKGILSGCLNFAVNRGLIASNPMQSVKLPSTRNENLHLRSKPNVYLNPDEIEQIFKRFPEGTTAHLPIMLGYKCGLRIGEVFGLTWDDIDFANNTIKVERQVQWDNDRQLWYFSSPKYNSRRVIDIDVELADLLKRTKQKQDKARAYYEECYHRYYTDELDRITEEKQGREIFFVTIREDGSYTQPRIMQHASAVIHQSLGYKNFTFHSLRHTHATMLAEANLSLKYIQHRLGHKKLKLTVCTYQHLTEQMKISNKILLDTLFKCNEVKKNEDK